ncbi:MAG: DNA translocase FtsK [Pyrinomonadaceae bacterium]
MATGARKKSKIDRSLYNEIAAIGLVALGLLMLLCLLTRSATDSSPNTSSSFPTENMVGIAGAWIADLLMQAVGNMAYVIPFLLFFLAWKSFRTKSLVMPMFRTIGTILFVFAGTGFITLLGIYGGIIGAFSASVTSRFLTSIGAGIVLGAVFLISLILIANASFFSFVDSFNLGFENFRLHMNEWLAKRRDRRSKIKAAMEAEDARLAKEPKRKVAEAKAGANAEAESENEPQPVIRSNPTISGLRGDRYPSIDNQPEISALENLDSRPANASLQVEKLKPLASRNGAAESSEDGDKSEKTESYVKPPLQQDFGDYQLPELHFLNQPREKIIQDEEELKEIGRHLEATAKEFNVNGEVKHINMGPVVTTFEFKPDAGVKYARVTGLADDLCLALKAESIRIERIPGKAVVGVEVPNKERETIFLRDVIDSTEFNNSNATLTIALGKMIDGKRKVADLAKMPHLLIAGATGAGKSVGVNSLIVSILYKARPDEVKFIMVDPKRLELGLYADIPHLATPIITEPKRASIALKWAVTEMEKRYKDLAGWSVRNIDGYNDEVKRRNKVEDFDDEGNPHKILPFIVIIIDELADLMMVSGKEVEESITRLAQMARAVGIHLVLATQRPSVDVITGLIKANFPSRIGFRVSSRIDSRTILDSNGAERLLGKGDMLFLPPGTSHLVRVHGAYVDEKEIQKIVSHIKSQGKPEYNESITKSEEEGDGLGELPGKGDELYEKALLTVVNNDGASTSMLQRHLRIGYGRAAAILDALAAEGYIGEMDGSKRARSITEKGKREAQEIYERENAQI